MLNPSNVPTVSGLRAVRRHAFEHDRRDRQPAVLAISPDDDDHIHLARILEASDWKLYSACTAVRRLSLLRRKRTPVVICERDLPDGNWKHILNGAQALDSPPLIIVVSRLADAPPLESNGFSSTS